MVKKQGQIAVGAEEGKKKPVLLAIAIVVGLLFIVGGFFLLVKPKQTAGHAIEIGTAKGEDVQKLAQKYTAGVEEDTLLPVKKDQEVDFSIWAYIPAGKQSVAWEFWFEFDAKEVKFVDAMLESELKQEWGETFWSAEEESPGVLHVKAATLNVPQALKGEVKGKAYRLAVVRFKKIEKDLVDTGQVEKVFSGFTMFKVYDYENSKESVLKGSFLQPRGKEGKKEEKVKYGLGSACGTTDDCVEKLVCEEGKCVGGEGFSVCEFAKDCASGLECTGQKCTKKQVQKEVLLGDTDGDGCLSDSEYNIFKAKYLKNVENIQSTVTDKDYNIYKIKFKKPKEQEGTAC